ncbi:MAG: ABC transporter permease subunit [Oscillibacter sp.]|nr:ABC transporter permease subunit [Oscillibacter sp.]
MDWFPLLNSLRVALLSTAIVFFPGLFAAYRVMRMPPSPAKTAWDAALTLPLVLPPPVVGWLVLRLLGPQHMLGYWARQIFGVRLVMTWPAASLAAGIVSFPLMYRAARAAFENFDHNLTDTARTLGRSEAWIFWNAQIPACKEGVIAAAVLAFARAFGEHGASVMAAGYTPGRTAAVGATVYQLWSQGDDAGAGAWAALSAVLSGVCLLAVSAAEQRQRGGAKP